VRDAECLEQRGYSARTFVVRQVCKAIRHVLLHCHVREQGKALKDVSHAAMRRWNVCWARRVEQESIANRDSSRVGCAQARETIKHRGFSGARCAEKDRKPGRHFEVDIEEELAMLRSELLFKSCPQEGRAPRRNRIRIFGYYRRRPNIAHRVLF
jgi:hypothetical protein